MKIEQRNRRNKDGTIFKNGNSVFDFNCHVIKSAVECAMFVINASVAVVEITNTLINKVATKATTQSSNKRRRHNRPC